MLIWHNHWSCLGFNIWKFYPTKFNSVLKKGIQKHFFSLFLSLCATWISCIILLFIFKCLNYYPSISQRQAKQWLCCKIRSRTKSDYLQQQTPKEFDQATDIISFYDLNKTNIFCQMSLPPYKTTNYTINKVKTISKKHSHYSAYSQWWFFFLA